MTVTPDMIAHARKCDCEKCKAWTRELEDAYLRNMIIMSASRVVVEEHSDKVNT